MPGPCDYIDSSGKRRLKTFPRKKAAIAYHTRANAEVRAGIHTPDAESVTVAQAAELWLVSCADLERTTVVSYEEHARLHIIPLIGGVKLSRLTVPEVRKFVDRLWQDRSSAMVKKIVASLGSMIGDAQERGLVARNVIRDLRSRRKRGQERQTESRQKGRLEVGKEISLAPWKSGPLSGLCKAAGAR